jgi:DNA helicase-2/ATP-dependent DNA helicase PcrA
VINPSDEEALKRVINYPGRGIGDTTVNRIIVKSSELGVPLWDVVKSAASIPDLGASAGKVDNFATMIKSFQTMLETHNAYDLAMHVAKQTGLLKLLYDDKSVEGVSRYENITELLNGIQEFVEDDESEKEKNLATFLEDVALYTDDQKDKDPDRDCVSLMTIHASKGLEYPVVFIVGIEENLFPSQLSLHSRADLEEERRLFYVAITRAEKKLMISYAESRYQFGRLKSCEPSRFIDELDSTYLKMAKTPGKKDTSNFRPVQKTGFVEKSTSASAAQLIQKPKLNTNYQHVPSANFVQSDPMSLAAGQRVEHQKFGFGTIQKLEVNGAERKAHILFEKGVGEKTLLLSFAKLMIIA